MIQVLAVYGGGEKLEPETVELFLLLLVCESIMMMLTL